MVCTFRVVRYLAVVPGGGEAVTRIIASKKNKK